MSKKPTPRKAIIKEDPTAMKTAVLPQVPPASAQEVADETGEEVVTVMVPKNFRFTDDQHRIHEYAAGVLEMPQSHSDHWFVQAQGVKPYVKAKPGKADE